MPRERERGRTGPQILVFSGEPSPQPLGVGVSPRARSSRARGRRAHGVQNAPTLAPAPGGARFPAAGGIRAWVSGPSGPRNYTRRPFSTPARRSCSPAGEFEGRQRGRALLLPYFAVCYRIFLIAPSRRSRGAPNPSPSARLQERTPKACHLRGS